MRPLNFCVSCGKDFAFLSGFDAHRIGTHEYTYSEGAHMDPIREDGRRCMATDEMRVHGFEQDANFRWCLRKRARTVDIARLAA